jgi:cobyrinic acid a,c-diamide synthase
MPVYAECGGFIYLSRGVTGLDAPADAMHPFVGIYPVTARMLPRRKALGYRQLETVADSILGPAGTVARGHEFHYSEMEELPPQLERCYRVSRQGVDLGLEGYGVNNCLASYLHLHFGSNPALASAFVASCRKFKKAKGQ